jgi:hypothetical protein
MEDSENIMKHLQPITNVRCVKFLKMLIILNFLKAETLEDSISLAVAHNLKQSISEGSDSEDIDITVIFHI